MPSVATSIVATAIMTPLASDSSNPGQELPDSPLAEHQRQAAQAVQQTQEAAEPVDAVADVLVVEADGVLVHYRDGWHEVKLGEVAGCELGNGRPASDPTARPAELVAPSYVATRASAAEFGPMLVAEAARRGSLEILRWEQPPGTDPRLAVVGPAEAVLRPVVVLGDGARWIWDLAAEHFGSERTEIDDYWHATEHVWTIARALHGDDPDRSGAWAEAWSLDLLEHGVEPLLAALRSIEPPGPAAEVVRVERGYFTTNAGRMDYPTFRAQGWPIGSGAVESAARHVVQVRMKRPGMRWSKHGGEAMLALCAYRAGNRPLPLPARFPRAA
jgi:hypothetical protein